MIEFTRRSQEAGYHGGLSLNVHAALLGEPYEPVLEALDGLVKMGYANPFGCAITMCPIWYMKGISRDWNSYGGNSYGISRANEQPLLSYTDVYNEAKELAEKYPGRGFVSSAEPTVKEVLRVREKLQLPIVLERQSDVTCLICQHELGPQVAIQPDMEPDDPFGPDDMDDDPDYHYEEEEF